MLNLVLKIVTGEIVTVVIKKLLNNKEESNMFETKSLLASKTVWGGLIAIGAAVGNYFGLDVAPTEQAELTQAFVSAAAAIGGIFAIVGRVLAKKEIKG